VAAEEIGGSSMGWDALATAIDWTERGYVPDVLIRAGIRRLHAKRLRMEEAGDGEGEAARLERFIAGMRRGPVAPVPEKAKEQHYELPPEFFVQVLGKRLKYSCCYWPEGFTRLDAAEEAALEATCSRAGIENGMEVLELGCGWGSASLWIAERYPECRVTAVSNSVPQRLFIEGRAKGSGLNNIRAITADMNEFAIDQRFDRVVSVEMFEHMRNYEALMRRIAGWLKPGGKLLVHVFCHRRYAYAFETEGADNWMGRHFFTGGIMPSEELLLHFQEDVELEERWRWNGIHYQKTSEAWLSNLDARREGVLAVLRETYGEDGYRRWFMRWRLFFLAVAELFGYQGGEEWGVSQYVFRKSGAA